MGIRPRQDKGDELTQSELDDAIEGIDDRLIAAEAGVVANAAAAAAASQPGHTHAAEDIASGVQLTVQDLVVTDEIFVANGMLPWKDLLGDVTPKTSGAGSPALSTFRNDVRWFSYAVGEDGDCIFHIPHDYAPGTDLFLHVHWAHNGTNISGSFDLRCHVTYAKGHNQETFPADIEPHIVVGSLNITNTPQYMHRTDEIQLSQSGGAALLLDTDLIEPDGIIMLSYDVDAIPTITGGTPNEVFIFGIDIHYQADHVGTLNRLPDFYT